MKKSTSTASMNSLSSIPRTDSNSGLSSMAMRALETVEDGVLTALLDNVREVAPAPETVENYVALLRYVATLCSTLIVDVEFGLEPWQSCTVPYLTALLPEEESQHVCARLRDHCQQAAEKERLARLGVTDEDLGPEVCNIEFSLAYGGKVLLHNTQLLLHRGRKYGLLGHNGAGKTTLMRNIANGKIEGMPEGLVFQFVESHFDDDNLAEMPVLEYMVNEPLLASRTEAEICDMLKSVLFTDQMLNGPTTALSGGWRMKLALAKAILVNPDIMLLDEPTNHLDVGTVQWLVDHLLAETHATVLIVSHDTGFLDKVCTDIIHYENQKLVRYPGNLSQFVEKKPEARSYYELASTGGLQFVFPNPGRLEGINSLTRAIVRMENVDFTYPGKSTPTLTNINCQLCLGSRIAVLGANGAGKSTLIRMLVGETLPSNDEGTVWKHHNLRTAYVAQHSFHHVEAHLESSPVEYIQWRYGSGADKESMAKETMKLSADAAEIGEKYGQIEALHSRRLRHGVLEYECSFVGGRGLKDNKYLTKDVLEGMGLQALMSQVDERVAAEAAGVDLRLCTTTEIQTHLDDFALAQEFGTYGKIKGLSGGQKVKLVLAAAMWTCPHLLVLDEPTNYLDREALGALADAIKNFGGGVIMISHNQEFYGALTNEVWNVADGQLSVQGRAQEGKMKLTRKKTEKDKLMEKAEETKKVVGGTSNTNETKERVLLINEKTGRPLSKKEIRAMAKKNKK